MENELEIKFKELEIILNKKIEEQKEKLQQDIIAGEILDKNGFIYSFKRTDSGSILLQEPSFFKELNLHDIVDIKTVPKSQKYNGKLTTDMIVHYKDENGERNFLFIERMFPPSGLAFPGGQVEKGETATINALKEIEEEIGAKITKDDLIHLGTFKGQEIRGTMKSEIYSVDLNKTFGDNFKKVLGLLTAGSDAISLISKKLGEVLGVKDERTTLKTLVPHHKEILEKVVTLLDSIDKSNNGQKVTLNESFSKNFTPDKKELSKLGIEIKDPSLSESTMQDPLKEKKRK